MAVALVLIVIGRFWAIGVEDWVWAVGALGLAAVVALGWTIATGRGTVNAAIELDSRFGLKERVASALSLPADQHETEAGRALIDDAVGRVERIDVAGRFSLSPGWPLLLPLLPGVLALLVAFLFSPAAVENRAAANAVQQQVKKSSKSLRRKLIEQRKKAKEKGLKDAEQLFKRLEQGTKQLVNKSPTDRKKALFKLNDLAKELKNRRRQLGGADKVKQQLDKLKDLGQGPAEKFARAASQGDFKKAIEELDKLKQALAKDGLNAKEKKELADQLEKMKDKLKDLTKAHTKAQDDLQGQIEQARNAGRHDEANRLEEQLQRLLDQLPQMQKLDQLADKLGKCSKCLKQGKAGEAGWVLEDAQGDLGDLRRQIDELEMLDESLGQLAQARDQMNCEKCGGMGCPACRRGFGGQGRMKRQDGWGWGRGDSKPGVGVAGHKGLETESDASFYDSQVKQKVGKGAATVVDLVEGPNVKGDVQQEISQQYDTARQQSTDPLTGGRIPRKHRKHALEYFERFRKGE